MAVRVIDLFREWDTDGNGKVSRAEFHKAMEELKFNVPAEEIDKLFDEWDPDGSGMLEMNELQSQLRRTAEISENLKAGAVAFEAKISQGAALRGGVLQNNGSNMLRGFDIDEDSDKTVAEQAAPRPDPLTALHC